MWSVRGVQAGGDPAGRKVGLPAVRKGAGQRTGRARGQGEWAGGEECQVRAVQEADGARAVEALRAVQGGFEVPAGGEVHEVQDCAAAGGISEVRELPELG